MLAHVSPIVRIWIPFRQNGPGQVASWDALLQAVNVFGGFVVALMLEIY